MDYPFAKNGWKVYDVKTDELFISLDVIIHEDKLPYCSQTEEEKVDMGYQHSEVLPNLKWMIRDPNASCHLSLILRHM